MRSLFSPLTLRRIHSFLSLFFTPLLVLFLVTGCWQMLVPEDVRDGKGVAAQLLDKLSTVHKDGYFPQSGHGDPSTLLFRILVAAMGACLLATILLGIWLAWKYSGKKLWALLALGLGVIIPALALWLA